MDTIYFDKSGSIPGFEYSSNGESGFIEYYPSIENLEPDINIDNYVVELLISFNIPLNVEKYPAAEFCFSFLLSSLSLAVFSR